jgi:hypothetical protein
MLDYKFDMEDTDVFGEKVVRMRLNENICEV